MQHSGLVKLFLLGFLAFAIYKYDRNKIDTFSNNISQKVSSVTSILNNDPEEVISTPETLTVTEEPSPSFIEKKITNIIRNTLKTPEGKEIVETIVKQLSNEDAKTKKLLLENFYFDEIRTGSGPATTCGQQVELSYGTVPIKTKEDVPTINEKDKRRFIVNLGSGKLSKTLEKSLVGMKKGGRRHITYTNSRIDIGNKNYNSFYFSDVTLNNVIPQPSKVKYTKITNKNINTNNTSTQKLRCGDEIILDYTLTDLKGNLLYDSKTNQLPSKSIKIGEAILTTEISRALDNSPINQELSITISTKELANIEFLSLPNKFNTSEEVIILSLRPRLSK
jgi:FKBP-type peptidyl-prolyl cis-trans isomerase 2